MLKIGANAAFGQMDIKGDAKGWLKDPKCAKTITISGQMYLMMLMEGLEQYSQCLVVYSNTDGLTVRVPRTQEKLFFELCDRWMTYTRFKLEFKRYRKMIIRDVNNYIMFVETTDEKERIKAKGAYLHEQDMARDLKVRGVMYDIISMAAREWYDKGTPIEETIYNSDCIYDFIGSQNTNEDKYKVLLQHADMNLKDKVMQKNNRWIITSGHPFEGRLVKVNKHTGERIEMQKGFRTTSVNDVDESLPIEAYKLNYNFYINQARALIDLTKPLDKETHHDPIVQANLFG
jgi:hypothetical protein